MTKTRERAGVVFIAVLCVLFCAVAEANSGALPAKVMINTGRLLLTTPQGKRVVYEQAGEDLLITPQTTLTSLVGICVVKVDQTQFILDKGDGLTYESGNDLKFRCLSGAIEAVFGQKTHKLGQGEVVALNSWSDSTAGPGTARWARSLGQRFSMEQSFSVSVNTNEDAPNGMSPLSVCAYNVDLPLEVSSYGQPQTQWASPSN